MTIDGARRHLPPADPKPDVSLASNTALLPSLLQSLGPLGGPKTLLVGVAILIAFLIVGRVLLAIAWRVVLIVIAAVVVLWILGMLGFQTGLL